MSIRLRFVISGACLPSFSGRQLLLTVPLQQEDESPTTTRDLKNFIRENWPESMSEMKETVGTSELKVLKTGNLLSDESVLRDCFTATELGECGVDPGAADEMGEEDQKRVLMHLVFQRNCPVPKGKKGAARDNVAGGGGGCCVTM
ncbi:putative Ubiquitin 2 like Rad60 SUMO like [Trypanosoma vivax]|uniref:UBL3-like ubiquitin domain-containing protein n=1 Tax=Trypanosoma vivax (strain Y486) TaxID=1055687 RepID=G0U531_TRYVY|nr:putative Ubiquitin 2 like Rad60 SUMO like [Trypanosoma vivax]CCC50979.1 conserved hypothetical protein [Trypanosoma vivax Y486]